MDLQSTDLLDYFRDVVLATAAKFQSWTETDSIPTTSPALTCDDFGQQLLNCVRGMSPQQVYSVFILCSTHTVPGGLKGLLYCCMRSFCISGCMISPLSPMYLEVHTSWARAVCHLGIGGIAIFMYLIEL